MSFHLAQLNIGRFHHPDDDPRNRDFFDALDQVNALAEEAPGFVWRYVDDSGAAIDTRPFDDPQVLINLSVWETVDDLRAFAYSGTHVEYVRRRREWFVPGRSETVLWWVGAGHEPTVEEAVERLRCLRSDGPTERAFTFAHRFDPPTV